MLWGVLYGKNLINIFLKELVLWFFYIFRSVNYRVMFWINIFSIDVKGIIGKNKGCERIYVKVCIVLFDIKIFFRSKM